MAGCVPAGPAAQGSQANPGSAPPGERVLTASIAIEPTYIAAQAPLPPGGASDFYQRMFNAFLDLYDDQGRPLPYLAEALPVLNSTSWVVFPDGRMETRYHLKPNVVWHDGKPLTSDDFVFAFQAATPAAGFRTAQVPYILMDDVVASDDRSLTIRWKSPYPEAAVLLLGDVKFGFVPLPRHILEQVSNQSVEAFQGHPYWTHEFVGAGPFKLDRWELGSYLEAVAFDQHVLGRPKIDRVRLLFVSDQNTAFANLLAGTTQVALDTITFAHMLQLKQEWGPTNRGTAGITVASLAASYIQHRPEYASPRAILDLRVHRALAHGIDKQTFAETVWAGELRVLDTIFEPGTDYYPAIDRAITKYPYDPRVSERLMNEAGYTKGSDGLFPSPVEGKLTFSIMSPQARREMPVLAANWRQAGFDMQELPLSAVEERDPQVRGTFQSLYVQASGLTEVQQTARYRVSEVSSAETRWRGENVTGWKNPAYDQLVDAFTVTLDPNERVQQRIEIAKLFSDEVPAIMLTDNPNTHAYLSSVKNISPRVPYRTTGRITWNIEQWDLQ
ncbi:MAG TPA: ABC transporter substrate-binding protein [Chloroflexota bacterium]